MVNILYYRRARLSLGTLGLNGEYSVLSTCSSLTGDARVKCTTVRIENRMFKTITCLWINFREYRRGNQKWTIQRNCQHRVHKTNTNKTTTQHNMCWTPVYSFNEVCIECLWFDKAKTIRLLRLVSKFNWLITYFHLLKGAVIVW